MCLDLNRLADAQIDLEGILCKYFPKTLLNSNKSFDVTQTWSFKNTEQTMDSHHEHDYVIGLGSTESAFLRVVSSIPIDSYSHADYAPLLVLKQYFCQTEVCRLPTNRPNAVNRI
jgi:hypothetical protein